jgi:hypothetical protein
MASIKSTLPALLLSVILVACGGGGSDAPPTEAPSTCTPIAQVRVQLFGDSTMVGYTAETDAAAQHAPVVMLQQILDARFGAGATLVTVRAMGGTTSGELLNGTDTVNQAWPKSVDADIRFHELLLERSGQPHAAQVWRSIAPRIRAYFFRYGRSNLQRVAEEHRELLEALQTREPSVIAAALEKHIAVSTPAPA